MSSSAESTAASSSNIPGSRNCPHPDSRPFLRPQWSIRNRRPVHRFLRRPILPAVRLPSLAFVRSPREALSSQASLRLGAPVPKGASSQASSQQERSLRRDGGLLQEQAPALVARPSASSRQHGAPVRRQGLF